VIDFGGPGLGDPAVDLTPAWNLFHGRSREIFRASSMCDDDTWLRGQGWSLSCAVDGLAYYWDTNPHFRANGEREVAALLGRSTAPG
jgi:aminoglycoside phosphotransferase (APT) family kinase protein